MNAVLISVGSIYKEGILWYSAVYSLRLVNSMPCQDFQVILGGAELNW